MSPKSPGLAGKEGRPRENRDWNDQLAAVPSALERTELPAHRAMSYESCMDFRMKGGAHCDAESRAGRRGDLLFIVHMFSISSSVHAVR